MKRDKNGYPAEYRPGFTDVEPEFRALQAKGLAYTGNAELALLEGLQFERQLEEAIVAAVSRASQTLLHDLSPSSTPTKAPCSISKQ